MKKILLTIILLASVPFTTFAEVTVDSDSMVTQMKAILDQYAAQIKALERENTILRNEMMKAGIQIPLSVYSGAIVQVVTASPSSTTSTVISSSGATVVSSNQTGALFTDSGAQERLTQIGTQYSSQYAGFIQKIHTDWSGIQGAYKLPSSSYIGGYEFVKKGSDNHVFVDIVYSGSNTTGIYDAKILYEYHTGTYQRKLVGFFEFDKKSGYYITRTGTNNFAGVTRVMVGDPFVVANTVSPVASVSSPTSTTGSVSGSVTITDIEKAYSDKRYLTTISLSDAYLKDNMPTIDLLRIRYRTFFIIGKYSESLAEIAKIEALGKLDKAIACDAQVIATYGKNQSLVSTYTKACSAK